MFRKETLTLLCLVFWMCLLWCTAGRGVGGEADLWQVLKTENTVGLIRHALAPGTGDPANFSIGDCATQRLLSPEGRKQAIKIGVLFRENGIEEAEIYSSQWCRCLETAKLLNLGPVEELKVLNSFFRRYENRDKQTSALTTWLANKKINRPLILVTHQVNITAFTGIFPGSGEMVVMKKRDHDNFTVIGTMTFE